MRTELVDITEGDGLIDVRGRDFDTLLLCDGSPVAINWNDCSGSVAQNLIRHGRPDLDPHFSPLVRYALEGNVDDTITLAQQFRDLVSLFVNGKHELRLGEPYPISETLALWADWDASAGTWRNISDVENFYPIDLTLVLTLPSTELDNERVSHFEATITSGVRPVIVAASAQDSWCAYVIDGHHKFAAYSRLNIRPTVLTVSRCEPPKLPCDTVETHFGNEHSVAKKYIELKRKYDA